MRIRFIWLILLSTFCRFSASAQIFDTILKTAPKERLADARNIYKSKLRKRDSVYAFAQLDQLTAIGVKLNDKPLAYAAYEFKADFFTVNFGQNPRSLYYFDKAIAAARKEGDSYEAGYFTFRKGQNYYTFKQYVPTYQYYLKAYDIYKTIGFENVAGVSDFLNALAELEYNVGDFESAKNYLLQALQYFAGDDQGKRINMINTVGLIFRGEGNYAEALRYFNRGLGIAKKNNIPVWVTIVSGNIGSIYFLQKDYARALPLLQADYRGSLHYLEGRNAAIAMLRIVKISIDGGKYQMADRQLDSAKVLLNSSGTFLEQRIDWYSLKAVVYEHTGRQALAAGFHAKYELAKDSLEKRNNIIALEGIKLKWELDKHQAEVKSFEDKQKASDRQRDALLVILGLLLVISVLIYNRQKLVRKRDKALFEKQEALLQLEKSKAEEDLLKARLELEEYTKSLRQKNALIGRYKAEIDKMQQSGNGVIDPKRVRQLENMMQVHIMTNASWLEFRRLFDSVHTGFFNRVNLLFTNLTETDVRILTLLKLGLKNREMANMLGITIEGIKKSKQRLHKKTGFSAPDLEEYVTQI
jgi:tetratricopeptide (TPR) repeat protein